MIYHAEHDPFRFRTLDTMSRLPRPGADEPNASGHEYYWSYAPLPPGHTVERRWLTEHEWEGDAAS